MRSIGKIFQYKVYKEKNGFGYEIFTQSPPHFLITESWELFDSEAQAEFAAVGHIVILEEWM